MILDLDRDTPGAIADAADHPACKTGQVLVARAHLGEQRVAPGLRSAVRQARRHGQPGMTDDTYGLGAEPWDRGDGQPDARLLEEALHRILQISDPAEIGLWRVRRARRAAQEQRHRPAERRRRRPSRQTSGDPEVPLNRSGHVGARSPIAERDALQREPRDRIDEHAEAFGHSADAPATSEVGKQAAVGERELDRELRPGTSSRPSPGLRSGSKGTGSPGQPWSRSPGQPPTRKPPRQPGRRRTRTRARRGRRGSKDASARGPDRGAR